MKQVVFFLFVFFFEKAKSLTVFTMYLSPHVDHKIEVQSITYIYMYIFIINTKKALDFSITIQNIMFPLLALPVLYKVCFFF